MCTVFGLAGGPGRWGGGVSSGQRLGDRGKLKFGVGCPIGGVFHKFTVYLYCTYVHVTVGESTDIDSVSLLQVFG